MVAFTVVAADAQTLTTLASFDDVNGVCPEAGLIADAASNLFGTTVDGGAHGNGTVFYVNTGIKEGQSPV